MTRSIVYNDWLASRGVLCGGPRRGGEVLGAVVVRLVACDIEDGAGVDAPLSPESEGPSL